MAVGDRSVAAAMLLEALFRSFGTPPEPVVTALHRVSH
jgi:hypothetical protein